MIALGQKTLTRLPLRFCRNGRLAQRNPKMLPQTPGTRIDYFAIFFAFAIAFL
jgi:hypothetical protein